MTREEAIKYLEQHAFIDDVVKDMCIEALGTDTNVGNKWIPCSERLPNDTAIHEVTAKFSNGTIYTEFAYYNESIEEWWKFDDDGIVNVIAWKEHSEPYKEGEPTEYKPIPTIKDSGNRTTFSTGAVRDIQEGKGAMYLLPLDVVAKLTGSHVVELIELFRKTGSTSYLYDCLRGFANVRYGIVEEMILVVSKLFEEGMKKYGRDNWKKGIPVERYIDSALRHLMKHRALMTDEPHDRAFVWNILCCIWTMENKPEMDDYTVKRVEG